MSGPHGTVCNLVYRRNRHNRLSAFGVSGTSEDFAIADVIDDWSQSPFGFWGDWNLGGLSVHYD